VGSVQALDFEDFRFLIPPRSPHIRFLFVDPGFCLRLPSDPAPRRAPLSYSYAVPLVGPARDFNPLEAEPYRAHPKKDTPKRAP